MPLATQLNLILESRTGTLARLCRQLADGGVNLLALSAPEVERGGTVRLLVANRELAERALARAGYPFTVEEVLFLELKNRPGALARAVEKLARAGIDIRYAYATAHTRAQKTAAVIAVGAGDLPRALKLLG
ncbi:MAG TPA: ACT domain-containing protein [Vicinamibacterales bacterium]|nr:ACT domain-containing protein [Vicinamibacterales bacterium]